MTPTLARVLNGLAHSAICVPDVKAATRWYSEVLGLEVLSPPYRMDGEQIERDMGELVPSPVVVTASIVGFAKDDRVLELIEYPSAGIEAAAGAPSVTKSGLTHIGMVCDDIVATRAELEARGVTFLTAGIADVAGLKTTWCHDPWGTVIILLEKTRDTRPYWGQLRPERTALKYGTEVPPRRPASRARDGGPAGWRRSNRDQHRGREWRPTVCERPKNSHFLAQECAFWGARRQQWAS